VGLALDGLRRRSALRLDAAVEQLIPPLSVPFALGLPLLLVGLAAGAPLVALLAALSLLGQVVYLLSALLLVGAPRRAYLGLGYAPAYVAWKVGLYARALVSSERSPWIRTARSAAETNQSVP
jgi:1,2-diacylglycerol 3-beta-glucosyltransferase